MTRKYETIHRQEHSYPVALMCQWAGVSKSGYYSWRSRPESATTTRRRRLTLFIKTEFSASDGTYGYRRITAALWRRGVVVDRDTVRSIMREQGLVAAQPRRKVRTTVPAADLGSRPDLVKRDFTADRPGMKWVGDITCIRTWEGLVYLATVLDCCTKKVVGYAMADNMRTDLICEAIDMAARRCPTRRGKTIFHSDRGSQYTSEQFARHLKGYGIHPSVGRTGVCWAGAWAEVGGCDPQGTKEPTPMVYPTRRKAINDIAFPGRAWYTSQTRLHSALGYRTPNEAEHDLVSSNKAA